MAFAAVQRKPERNPSEVSCDHVLDIICVARAVNMAVVPGNSTLLGPEFTRTVPAGSAV